MSHSKKPKIIIKTPEEIKNLREWGKYHAELLQMIRAAAKPGVSLIELENISANYIAKYPNLKGSFKNYNGFPANLCLSINDCIVHGIPDKTILKEWDLLKIDLGITYQKTIVDAAISHIVGGDHTNKLASDLSEATKNWLDACIHLVQPEKKISEYSQAIYSFITERNFSIIRSLTGHGVGRFVHEDPPIYNFPHPKMANISFLENMVVAIEPITAITSTDFKEKPGNERNLYTKNGDLWCQREYTLLVTKNGPEILAGLP